MANIKPSEQSFLNPYEEAYVKLKETSPFFTETYWSQAAKSEELPQYVNALEEAQTKIPDIDKFNVEYGLQFGTDQSKVNALYNEIYADREKVEKRQIAQFDSEGNYTGSATVEMTDYDYYKQAIQRENRQQSIYYAQQKLRDAKKQQSALNNFKGFLADLGGATIGQIAEGLDDISELFYGVYKGFEGAANGRSFAESMGEAMASDRAKLFKSVEQDIMNWEMKYGWRDIVTGQYNGWGEILGGALGTIFKQLPTAAIGAGIGKSLSISSESTQLATSATTYIASQTGGQVGRALFYAAGEFGQNFENHYRIAKENGLSVNYTTMLLTDVAVAAAKMGIEDILSNVFGVSYGERTLYKMSSKSTIGKDMSLFARSFLEYINDSVHEGLEEVMQDGFEALVYQAYGMFNADYAQLSSMNSEEICTTFIVAALSSIIGNAYGTIKIGAKSDISKIVNAINAKRIADGKTPILTDIANAYSTTIVEQDGKARKLNRFEQFVYNMDLQNAISQTMELVQAVADIKNYDLLNIEESKAIIQAAEESYASMRTILGLFGAVGKERSNEISFSLIRLSALAAKGQLTTSYVDYVSDYITSALIGNDATGTLSIEGAYLDTIKKRIEKAGLDGEFKVIKRGQKVEGIGLTKETVEKIKQILDENNQIDKLVITERGKGIVVAVDNAGKVSIASSEEVVKELDNIKLLQVVADQRLVQAIVDNKTYADEVDRIFNLYKQFTGKTDDECTKDDAISALYFSPAFYEAVLYTSQADGYKLLSQLKSINDVVERNTVLDAVYKKKLEDAIETMHKTLVAYCKVNELADLTSDIFTEKDIVSINNYRYAHGIRERALTGKLTKADITVITNKVNSLPLQNVDKEQLIQSLTSDPKTAFKRLDELTEGYFTSKYNGQIYMPNNSIANMAFNNWLKSIGKTIADFTQTATDAELKFIQTNEDLRKQASADMPAAIFSLRKMEFESSTNGMYTFDIDSNGNVGIYQKDTGKQVGYNIQRGTVSELSKDTTVEGKSFITKSTTNHTILESFVDTTKVDDVTLATMTINDLLLNPELIAKNLKNEIIAKYGILNTQTAFLYLKDKVFEQNNNVSIGVMNNGSYVFTNVAPMKQVIRKELPSFEVNKNYKASDVFDKKYLYGRNSELQIKVVEDNTIDSFGYYDHNSNTIVISNTLNNDKALLQYVLVHEFQHAVQTVNAMNAGFTSNFIEQLYNDKLMSKNDVRKILLDIAEHVDGLFNDDEVAIIKDKKTNIKDLISYSQRASEYLYYTTAETEAFGANPNTITLYPCIVSTDAIVTPWGAKYKYNGKYILPQFKVAPLYEKDGKQYYLTTYTDFNRATINKLINIANPKDVIILNDKSDVNLNDYTLSPKIYNIDNGELYNDFTQKPKIVQNISAYYDSQDTQFQPLYEFLNNYVNTLLSDSTAMRPTAYAPQFYAYNLLKLMLMPIEDADKIVKHFENTYVVKSYEQQIATSQELLYANKLTVSEKAELLNMLQAKRNLEKTISANAPQLYYMIKQLQEAFPSFDYNKWNDEYAKIMNETRSIFEYGTPIFEWTAMNINMAFTSKTDINRNINTRKNILAKITPEIKEQSLHYLHITTAPWISYEQFINSEMPIMRIQNNLNYYNTPALSYSCGPLALGLQKLTTLANFTSKYNEGYNWLVVGSIKPKDLEFASNDGTFEAVANPRKVHNTKIVLLNTADRNIPGALSAVEGEVYTLDDMLRTQPLSNIGQKPVAQFAKIPDDYRELKPEEMPTEKPGHKYTERHKYTAEDTQKKDMWRYRSPDTRIQVSKTIAGDTNLKYYVGAQIQRDFASFIEDADGTMYDDLIHKGKLTRRRLISDFAKGKIQDNNTFKLLNKHIFKNNDITSVNQLDEFVSKSGSYYIIGELLKYELGVTEQGYKDLLEKHLSPKQLDIIIDTISKDPAYRGKYSKLALQWENLGEVNENYARMLLMQNYDGTINSLHEIGVALHWAMTRYSRYGFTQAQGYGKNEAGGSDSNLDPMAIVGDEHNFGYMTPEQIFDYKVNAILKAYEANIREEAIEKGKLVNEAKLKKGIEERRKVLEEKYTDAQVNALYTKMVVKSKFGELDTVTKSDVTTPSDEAEEIANEIGILERNYKTSQENESRKISHNVGNSIIKWLSPGMRTLFVKKNSEYFNKDLTLKDDVKYTIDEKGRKILKPLEELQKINQDILQIGRDVRAGAYKSQTALKEIVKIRSESERAAAQIRRTIESGQGKLKSENVETIVAADGTAAKEYAERSITISTPGKIPEAIRHLMGYALGKKADTNIKFLNDGDTQHMVVSLKTFVEDNIDYLSHLTQTDIDEIIEFYTVFDPDTMLRVGDIARWSSLRIMILAYIMKQCQVGTYTLSTEVMKTLNDRLQAYVSEAGTSLNAWKNASDLFRPDTQIVQQFYNDYGIYMSANDITNLAEAFRAGDIDQMTVLKQELYKKYTANYKAGQKVNKTVSNVVRNVMKAFKAKDVNAMHNVIDSLVVKAEDTAVEQETIAALRLALDESFANNNEEDTKNILLAYVGNDYKLKKFNKALDKIFNIERDFMLSSPGTWVRNETSNLLLGGIKTKEGKVIIPGMNIAAEGVSKVIAKLFPKKGEFKTKQYRIVGTKVTSEVQTFIKQSLLDNNLIYQISTELNRYKLSKTNKMSFSSSEMFAELIVNKMAQDVFNQNHKISSWFARRLSDQRFIDRDVIRYFGKMLTEEIERGAKINLANGLNDDTISKIFLDAYLQAANDYMHKTNFIHDLEHWLEHGDGSKFKGIGKTGMFAIHQLFPFAGSSMNWWIESLKYTPLGLVNAIKNYARLEHTIDKLLEQRDKGLKSIPASLAQYNIVRDIGKGILGSIGWLIGLIFTTTGTVKMVKNKGQWYIKVGNAQVDISDIYGTSSLLLGMQLGAGISNKDSFWNIIRDASSSILEDSAFTSVFNTMRYNNYSVPDALVHYFTYEIPGMFIPAGMKALASSAKKYDVYYDEGLLGNIEKLAVNSIPFLDRAFPKRIDPFTGEWQVPYSHWWLTNINNKFTAIKIYPYKMSDIEKLVISYGLNKSDLSCNYKIDGDKIKLSSDNKSMANQFYGKLNKDDLYAFIVGGSKYEVEMPNGSRRTLSYSQMSNEQRKSVIERIMSNNAKLTKAYILTSTNKYKYYTDRNTYNRLRQLNVVNNVYVSGSKLQGFVKI